MLPIIQDGLTTSLCVIVNPNFIENEYKEEEDQSEDQDFPFIMLLDAVGLLPKWKVSNRVRKWLNYDCGSVFY